MELRYALGYIPEAFISFLQIAVSLRRIAKYLDTQEVSPVQPLQEQAPTISFEAATISWPQECIGSNVTTGVDTSALVTSVGSPRRTFLLMNLTVDFPQGELSLICGKLGSGKTLLLLALLGEADILTGQLICPRSSPDSLATFMHVSPDEEWVLPNMCAYVPQVAWLQNASIKENILFNLSYDETRYRETLEVCSKS
jgi:ABC-type multidrug transport system fused ATPase/permease subunit